MSKQAKKASKRKKFRFRFASFRFEAKMTAVFASFLLCFRFLSFFVSHQISTFRIDAKTSEKEAKTAVIFASKRNEAKLKRK
jgi:hypothetical protein